MDASSQAATAKFYLTPRQKKLLPIVMIGAFFEGFDFMVINLALPFITKDFGINVKTAGMMVSTIAIGALIAFFVVRLADKFGRRPIFLISVVIYSIVSLLTAFSANLYIFVSCQLIGRVFLVACLLVGYIIMTEEFVAELRGRAVGLFQSAAAVGAIFPSLIMPLFAGSWLEWRGLYVIGALPLLAVVIWGKNLHETEHFLAVKKGGDENKPSLFAVFEAPYRKHLVAIMFLWFFMYLCYASSMNFFSYRVVEELGWTSKQVGPVMTVAYTVGLLGYYVAGKLLDRIGRKRTAYIFFACGSIAVICTFQATHYLQILLAQTAGVFCVGSFTVLCATFTNELFPTSIRANAMAWGNNIVGRIGTIVAPVLVGTLAASLNGTGNAVSLLALSPFICIAIIMLFLPEPMGYTVPEYIPGSSKKV